MFAKAGGSGAISNIGKVLPALTKKDDQVSSSGKTQNIKYYGGVVPHHLLANVMISDFFSVVSSPDVKTVVLLGPNHKQAGETNFSTSDSIWNTKEGNLNPEMRVINNLTDNELVSVDNKIVSEDHSISLLVPLIKHHFPNANLVPLISKGSTPLKDIEVVSSRLINSLKNDFIVIGSVDFSHGLKPQDAQINDKETLEYIINNNYNNLLMLQDEHLDSPASVVAVLMLMEKFGKQKMEVLDHKDAATLMGDGFSETTSYYSIVFY